jgi:4-aminobutyrate aminotransferase-like enzyme
VEDEGLAGRAAELGPAFREGVAAALAPLGERVGEVRGVGLMLGAEIVRDRVSREPDASMVRRLALLGKRHGLIIGTSWDWTTIVLLPPLTMTRDQMGDGLARLEAAASDAVAWG